MVSFVTGTAVVLGLAVPWNMVWGQAVRASLLARNDRQSFRGRQLLEHRASMEHMTVLFTNRAHLHFEVVSREAHVQFLWF